MKYNRTNYRKNTFTRKYNKNTFNLFKKANKLIRDKVSPDPYNQLNNYGFGGKFCNKVANRLTVPIIREAAYSTTSLTYDKKKDKPYKGSILYTIYYFLYSVLFVGLVSLVIQFLS